LDAGVLRLLVLLAGLARRAPWPTGTARPAGRHGGRAGGRGDRASAPNPPSAARGRWRCGRGWSPGACWRAAGGRGHSTAVPAAAPATWRCRRGSATAPLPTAVTNRPPVGARYRW